MLNRTNRTLSAHTNRLNLGTRQLDQNASDNTGSLTLRTAHRLLPVVRVRTGIREYPGLVVEVPPILAKPTPTKPAMPRMVSGSSPSRLMPTTGLSGWDQGQSASSSRSPVRPQVSLTPGHPRSSLGWHCELARQAGRSAAAALANALLSGSAPHS